MIGLTIADDTHRAFIQCVDDLLCVIIKVDAVFNAGGDAGVAQNQNGTGQISGAISSDGGNVCVVADKNHTSHFGVFTAANAAAFILTDGDDLCVAVDDDLSAFQNIAVFVAAAADSGAVTGRARLYRGVAADPDRPGDAAILSGSDTGPLLFAPGRYLGVAVNGNIAAHFAIFTGADARAIVAAGAYDLCVICNGNIASAAYFAIFTGADACAAFTAGYGDVGIFIYDNVTGHIAFPTGTDGRAVSGAVIVPVVAGCHLGIPGDMDAAGHILPDVAADLCVIAVRVIVGIEGSVAGNGYVAFGNMNDRGVIGFQFIVALQRDFCL